MTPPAQLEPPFPIAEISRETLVQGRDASVRVAGLSRQAPRSRLVGERRVLHLAAAAPTMSEPHVRAALRMWSIRRSIRNARLNPKPFFLTPQPSTVRSYLVTLKPQPLTLNPKP
eukprot:1303337-Rhodomonas_salina.2